ncbi:hypothetical protein SGFS_017900 [Streptomyces graminofaciens]|uniref:FAD dependent oxidoreductase domain-containing protein n=1 Tax=Streptomyces graminofaciens TaxID=68212 RepID=A0ABN5VBK1_9ACTN|nr:FAD-dependent oxidoreductase [Streptomyces graminofaciens]BBC30496.1 hypothetical protein SGFS_017900 [Streptomyces graminofaciens]
MRYRRGPWQSYWMREALADERPGPSETLRGRHAVDVCVVGGGYTGLWTAIELKTREPGVEVAVIEGQLCGSGASGANAGYLMNLWPKYSFLDALVGRQEALRLARASSDAVDEIIEFCQAKGIDAGIRREGWLWTSTSPAQDGAWTDTQSALDGVAECPLREVGPAEALRLGGIGARGGVFDPTAATLQPALLARGLRRAALDLGVQVFEDTPVRTVSEKPGSAVVHTDTGEVRADGVVLAINAWMAGFPSVRKRMVVTASDNLVTRALPGELLEQAGQDGIGVSDSTRLLNYWRTTGDGRLLFGKGGVGLGFGACGADSMFGPASKRTPLGQELRRILPMATRAGVQDTWRAPVEYSLTSLPFFEALPGHERVFYGAGYSGDGVGPARLGGKILASLVLREQDEWSQCGLVRPPQGWLPPEPFRFLGGQLVKSALLRIEAAENAGRTPHLLARTLGRLDPTNWV